MAITSSAAVAARSDREDGARATEHPPELPLELEGATHCPPGSHTLGGAHCATEPQLVRQTPPAHA
jgi:hypothetical protein